MHLIVGCPRSGSHYLASRLERYADVVVPTESRFLAMFLPVVRVAGDLRRKRNRIVLLKAIFAFIRIWETRNRSASYVDSIRRFSLLRVGDQIERIADEADDFAGMVRLIYRGYREAWQAAAVIEKNTYFFYEPIGPITDLLPEAKVVHIVRDGRNAARSWTRTWFGPSTIIEAGRLWSQHVAGHSAWGADHPPRYLEVRYEDLVENENARVAEVAAFLGLEPRPEPLDVLDKERVLASQAAHRNIVQPTRTSSDSVSEGERHPATEMAAFEDLFGDTLQAKGYRRSGPGGAGRTGSGSRLRLAGARLREYIRPNTYKRYALAFLPVLLIAYYRLTSAGSGTRSR